MLSCDCFTKHKDQLPGKSLGRLNPMCGGVSDEVEAMGLFARGDTVDDDPAVGWGEP